MKKLKILLVAMFALVLLTACKGSGKIQGTWHARNASEANVKLVIKKDTISLNGEKKKYTQNGLGYKNGVHYYTIKLKGTSDYYSIIFPKKDGKTAVMLRLDDKDKPLQGTMVLAMNKEKTPNYADYASKYIK